MASCTNCGNDLAEGAQFCTTCGTPAAGPPVAGDGAPTARVPSDPAATEPVGAVASPPEAPAPVGGEPTAPVPPFTPDATVPGPDPTVPLVPLVPPGEPTQAVPQAPLWNPGGAPEASPGYAAGGEPPLWDPSGTGESSSSGVPKVLLIGIGALVGLVLLGLIAGAFLLTRGGDDDDDVATGTSVQQTSTTAADDTTTAADDTTTSEADDTTTTEDSNTSTTDGPAVPGVPTADVGACVTNDLVNGSSIDSFDEVPCSQPHRGELFLKFDLPDGPFPGQDAINAEVSSRCQGPEFDAYVGQTYATSEAYVSPVSPSQQTWDNADDREVLCFLVLQDGGERTGSYRNSGL